ncbi:MAG: heavy-metal-associated domain-containing protein [Clostridiales bacterium]|jgi:copper chaperone|nr:heavy-metal-associated domain-containing protein [Clostridiales bacterium]
MTILKVTEMHCEKCVERITNALNEGGLKFSVSLPDQTVTIDGCDSCVKTAVEKLDDLGFSAEKID